MKKNGIKNIDGVFSWNGYYYGRNKSKFYKCKTARFDNTFGGVIEITADEYFTFAEKYANVFYK